MDLRLPDDEMRKFENHIAQGGYSQIIECGAVRHPEEAMIDFWIEDTKLGQDTHIFALIPGERDFLEYMELNKDDLIHAGEARTLQAGDWLKAPLENTLKSLCAEAISPEIMAIKRDLYNQRELLIPFMDHALVQFFVEEKLRTHLLLDGQDLISATTFSGPMEELANFPNLLCEDYQSFLALLQNHNPYVVMKKRAGTPYRALVNILFAVDYAANDFEPGLSILPIKSSGHYFRPLLPSVIVA